MSDKRLFELKSNLKDLQEKFDTLDTGKIFTELQNALIFAQHIRDTTYCELCNNHRKFVKCEHCNNKTCPCNVFKCTGSFSRLPRRRTSCSKQFCGKCSINENVYLKQFGKCLVHAQSDWHSAWYFKPRKELKAAKIWH